MGHTVVVGTHHMPVVGMALVVEGRDLLAGDRLVEDSHWDPEVEVERLQE